MACKGPERDLREDAPNIGYQSNLGWIPLGRKKKTVYGSFKADT